VLNILNNLLAEIFTDLLAEIEINPWLDRLPENFIGSINRKSN
jgi:hypothetical protein